MNITFKRFVVPATIVGFLLPIVWGGLEFVFFDAPESFLTKMFFFIAYATCPPWFISGFWGDIGSPFLNAALYGCLGYALSKGFPSFRGRTAHH